MTYNHLYCGFLIAFITLIGQAVSIFSDASPIYFFWIVLVIFLQRGADVPPEDDVTPVATSEEDLKKSPVWFLRAMTLAFCVTLTGAMVLPVPKFPSTPTVTTTPAQAPLPSFAPVPAPRAPVVVPVPEQGSGIMTELGSGSGTGSESADA